jgi:hypothetical protein
MVVIGMTSTLVSLSSLLFKEAMALSTGGASLGASSQVVGVGPVAKKGTLAKASQAPSRSLEEITDEELQESFGAMHEPDFDGPSMPGLWAGLEDVNAPVKTDSPELHPKRSRNKR